MPTQISLKSNDKQIPLKKVNVDIDVVGLISQFTINQTYFNDEDKPLEVTYTFPTPSGATVYDFQALIEDKVVKCIIKDKDQARKEYSEAISSGDGAYLMEQITGDVFNCCIGNIPSKKEVTLTIRYVLQLQSEIDAKRLRLNFPLTIMPRYEGSNSNVLFPKTETSGPSVNNSKVDFLPYEFSMNGTMYMPEGLEDVKCKTHTLSNCIVTENACTFNIEKFESINSDMIINISRSKPSTVAIQQKTDLPLTDEIYRYCTMINVVPDFDEIEMVNPKDLHYSFILDRSGSMQGRDLENCKEAASIFVSMLPVDATFDVYHFGSDYAKFVSTGHRERKLEAVEWIQNIYSYGGTELFNVLSDALQSIYKDKKGVVVLLSDGGISNTESVVQLCSSRKDVRVFTIGIGDSVSQELIQGLADEGCGKAEFVASGDKDAIRSKVISQLCKSQSKMSIKNVLKIECESDYIMTPDSIRTIYNDDNNISYVFSKTPVKSVTYEQDNAIMKCEIMNDSAHDGCPIHRIAGNKLIKTIASRKTKSSQLYYVPQPSSDKKTKITDVSKNLNILCEHTSFIGVEYRIGSDKTLDESTFKEVPLQMAKKYVNTMAHNNMTPFFGSLPNSYIKSGHHVGINTVGQSFKNANVQLRGDPSTRNITVPVSPWLSSSISPDLCRRSFDIGSLECSTNFVNYTNTLNNCSSGDRDRGTSQKRYMDTRADERSSYEMYMPKGSGDNSEEGELGLDLFGGFESTRYNKVQITPIQLNVDGHAESNTKKLNVKTTIDKLINCYFINNKLLTSRVNCSICDFTNGLTIDVDDYISITDVNFIGVYKVISVGSSMIPWVLEKV